MGRVVSWSTATFLGRLCLCTQRAFDDHWKAQGVRRAENGIGIITQGSSNFPKVGSRHLRDKTGKRYLERTTNYSNYSNVCLFEPFPLFPAKWHHWHRLVIKSWLSASLAKRHWDTRQWSCVYTSKYCSPIALWWPLLNPHLRNWVLVWIQYKIVKKNMHPFYFVLLKLLGIPTHKPDDFSFTKLLQPTFPTMNQPLWERQD